MTHFVNEILEFGRQTIQYLASQYPFADDDDDDSERFDANGFDKYAPHVIADIRHADAVPPRRMTRHAAGYDLSTPASFSIPPSSNHKIDLHIGLSIEHGYYGKIESRSSLAHIGVTVEGGIIDSDYSGNVAVILRNHNPDRTMNFAKGERIAQLLILQHERPFITVSDRFGDDDDDDNDDEYPLIESDHEDDDYRESDIRSGGFGSTGR